MNLPAAIVSWKVVGASVRGILHACEDKPCQDAFVAQVYDGILVLAVADGAGSASSSDQGAVAAADAAVASVIRWLRNRTPDDESSWLDCVSTAIGDARAAVLALAQARAQDLHDFAATLSCVVCCDGWIAAGQIGDGLTVACFNDSDLCVVIAPQRGEFVNETTFVTASDALSCAQYAVLRQDAQAIAAMTDSLVRLCVELPTYTPLANFFQPLFAFAKQASDADALRAELEQFLDSPRVNSRTNDDKTLVLVVRTAHAKPTLRVAGDAAESSDTTHAAMKSGE